MPGFCGGWKGEGRAADYPSFSACRDGAGISGDAVKAVHEDYYASIMRLQKDYYCRNIEYELCRIQKEVLTMNRLKKLFVPVDMTVGKPWEDIVIFTVPMLIGNIAQQLYNTVEIGRAHV